MNKLIKLAGIFTLTLAFLTGCIDNEKKVQEYKVDNPVELKAEGNINEITFNLYSINEGLKGSPTQINLFTYQNYDVKKMSVFMKGYVDSLKDLSNDIGNIRVDVYKINSSQLDVINDKKLLSNKDVAQLTWVYEKGKLYPQDKQTSSNKNVDSKENKTPENLDELMDSENGNNEYFIKMKK